MDELRQRRAKGETGLIIRNDVVLQRQLHPNVPNSNRSAPTGQNSDQSSDQSSKQSS